MSKSEYITKYIKDNLRRFEIKLNKNTDADLIAWLNRQKPVNQYIKNLIEQDKKKSGN